MDAQSTEFDFAFDVFGLYLEGFFFGLYSGIFVLHWQLHESKKGTDNARHNIIFYALCTLYVVSVAVIALDIAICVVQLYNVLEEGRGGFYWRRPPVPGSNYDHLTAMHRLSIAQPVVFACCDFIAQFILIHRCWIVWGRNIRVVIVPAILAFAFLAMWIAANGTLLIEQGGFSFTILKTTLVMTSLTISMSVNALVTGLIVFRIFRVFREIRRADTPEEKSLGVTGGSKLRSVMFVIIESGMALFVMQLVRLIITATDLNSGIDLLEPLAVIVGIHQMLNGITPTIILVRVSMGLSFHHDTSLVETANDLQFAAHDLNSIPGIGSISHDGSLCMGPDDPILVPAIASQGRRDDDIGGGDDIQMVDI